MIEGFDTSVAGDYNITLKYDWKEIKIPYEVKELKVLQILSVSGLKTEWNYKEELNLNNVKITYKTDKGNEEVAVSADMIYGFNTNSIGEKTMTIHYGNKTYDFDYEVKAIKKINSVNRLLTQYYEDVYQSLNNVTAECENHDGTISIIDVTKDMITGFDYNTVGSRTMTITITGVGYNWNYEVIKNEVTEIISIDNLVTNYEKSGKLNLNGATITYALKNGDTKTTSIVSSMVSGFDTTTVGTKTMTITFEGKTKTSSYKVFDITDVVSNGLYFSQVNNSKGEYLYVYVDGKSTSTGNFRVILSDTAPERMIDNDDLYRLGTAVTGTRSVEDGYIKYATSGYSNVRFEIRVINGASSLIFEYSSEPDNVSFASRNLTKQN